MTERSMRVHQTLAGVSLLLFALMLAAPALAARERDASGPDPAVAEWTQWPHRVSCGGRPFDPVAAFSSSPGVEMEDTPQVRAMEDFIKVGEDLGIRRHDWRLLVEAPAHVEFGSGRLRGEMEWIVVDKRQDDWHFSGYTSNCEPATLRHGQMAITWDLATDQPQLRPSTRSILVNLGPGPCNGGRRQSGRLEKPEFREQNGNLLMTLWLRPLPPGGYTCQGVVEPPVRFKLPTALGDRELLDGGTYPPRVTQLEFGR
jgi:hypothetical protein